jgi:hypothetical protein
LIAEVHAEFEWPAPAPTTQSPAQASLVLIQMFLQAMPESEGDFSDWESAAVPVEVALGSAMERALAVVERWRDVPQIAVDAVKETRALVTDQLSDEPSNPLWLRPDWLSLCPGLQAFRRRRRLARRGLIDPDSQPIRGDAPDNTDSAGPRDPVADEKPPLEPKA